MATITFYLSSKIKKATNSSEIYIRFSYGRGRIWRSGTNIYIDRDWWSTKNRKFKILKVEGKQYQVYLAAKKKLDDLERHVLSDCESLDKNDITKTWLVNCIKTFNHPEIIINKTENLQFLQHVQHFIDKAPQRRNRDGVHLKPNAIQQYKATQMHLTNATFKL